MLDRVFFNPIIFGGKYAAYMDDGELVLIDIFEQGLLNKRIERDFTETADPMSAILSIKMIDDKTIELSYYSGADYSERTENITL